MRHLLSVVVNAVAIWVATLLLPGMHISTEQGTERTVVTYLVIGAIFGVVNAIVRPIVTFVSLPLYIITLGLFSFVVNAAMLWLTSRLAGAFGLAFHLDSFFWTAVLGAIVVSIVSALGHALIPKRSLPRRRDDYAAAR